MTSNDILYKVKADNGLGGTIFGRDAADELAAELIARTDVVSVEAGPIAVCAHRAHVHYDIDCDDRTATPITCVECGLPSHWDEYAGAYVHDDPAADCLMVQHEPFGATPCEPVSA